MNIRWGIETTLNPAGATKVIKVGNDDLWEGVLITEPTRSFSRVGNTTTITYEDNVFINIPTRWYVIEN